MGNGGCGVVLVGALRQLKVEFLLFLPFLLLFLFPFMMATLHGPGGVCPFAAGSVVVARG